MAFTNPTYPSSVFQGPPGAISWNNPTNVLANDGQFTECGLISGGLLVGTPPDFASLLLVWGNDSRTSVLAVFTSGTTRTFIPTGSPTLFTYETDINNMAAADVDGTQLGIAIDVEFPLSGLQYAPANELIVNNFQFNFPFPIGAFVTHAKVEFQGYSVSPGINVSGIVSKFADLDFFRLTLTFGSRPYATDLGTATSLGTMSF